MTRSLIPDQQGLDLKNVYVAEGGFNPRPLGYGPSTLPLRHSAKRVSAEVLNESHPMFE